MKILQITSTVHSIEINRRGTLGKYNWNIVNTISFFEKCMLWRRGSRHLLELRLLNCVDTHWIWHNTSYRNAQANVCVTFTSYTSLLSILFYWRLISSSIIKGSFSRDGFFLPHLIKGLLMRDFLMNIQHKGNTSKYTPIKLNKIHSEK